MTKVNQAVEAKLAALVEHVFGKDAQKDEAVLIAALGDRSSRVIGKAAELAGERLCFGATTALKESFRKLLEGDVVKKDPQCMAKQAIVRALVAIDCPDAQFYLASLGYRQMEPVWGGSIDTAIDVRASCAMGLVNCGYPRALHEITALLNDDEARARLGAVRAIACGIPSEAELLLRFKILIGDEEPEVVGECFAGLLRIAKADGVRSVAGRLSDKDEAVKEYAAIALGESQLPEALHALQAAAEAVLVDPTMKRVLARAAALHRTDAAFDWLLSWIAEGSMQAAEAALEALSIYKNNAQLSGRVRQALSSRHSVRLNELLAKLWS
jgi:HEAT repeat protein